MILHHHIKDYIIAKSDGVKKVQGKTVLKELYDKLMTENK